MSVYSTIYVCTCRIFVPVHIVICLQVYDMYIRVYGGALQMDSAQEHIRQLRITWCKVVK